MPEIRPMTEIPVGQRVRLVKIEGGRELTRRLLDIHTGEMVPFFIQRYGFYEGHTVCRADPLAIASVFGLRSIEEIDRAIASCVRVPQ